MIPNEKHAKKSPEGLQLGPKVRSNTLWEQILKVPSGGRADQAFYSFFGDRHHVPIIFRCWKQWWPQIFSTKIFWCSYRAKMGCFLPFLRVKIKTHISEHLWWDFFTGSERLIFRGFPKNISVPMDKQFWNYALLKRPKRGIFAVFWVKIQTQLSGKLWWNFFYFMWKNYFLEVPKKNFSPNGWVVLKLWSF